MFPGGNSVNVPVLAHRLGHPAAYLGWLAADPHGLLVYNSIKEEGLDVSHCRLIEGKNAFCEVTLKHGERVFGDFCEGICDQIDLNDEDFKFISGFDLVHTSVYSFISPYLKQLKSESKVLSYDFSQEWDRDSLAETLPFVDIALISNTVDNIEENKELINYASSFGPVIVLVTSGEHGALLYDGSQFYHQPIYPVEKVIDTLGAGDAFASRFMVDYLSGFSVRVALQNAAISAAKTCMYYGAFGHGVSLYKNQ
ncbi:MAG: PfkB family carbohydrate kinase [Pelolinea sp.]|nr:PfkB family carbohydrate kinase [Pelolinea sp.]